jgi:hypothetical protein
MHRIGPVRAAFLITAKDLRQRLRDRSAFLVAVVAPLALAFALGVTISGFSAGSETFQLGLVDLDARDHARDHARSLGDHAHAVAPDRGLLLARLLGQLG